jgi:hypothetical protein
MNHKWTVALGAAVVGGTLFVASAAGVIAIEPCCTVKSINARAGLVVVAETKTGCTYEVQVNDAKSLERLKTGAPLTLDLQGLVPKSGPTQAIGQAATSSGTEQCGSNVSRNANTKPAPGKCYRIEAGGKMVEEACKPR